MTEAYQAHRTNAMARLLLDAELRAKNIIEKLGGVWRGTKGECRCPAHADNLSKPVGASRRYRYPNGWLRDRVRC